MNVLKQLKALQMTYDLSTGVFSSSETIHLKQSSLWLWRALLLFHMFLLLQQVALYYLHFQKNHVFVKCAYEGFLVLRHKEGEGPIICD